MASRPTRKPLNENASNRESSGDERVLEVPLMPRFRANNGDTPFRARGENGLFLEGGGGGSCGLTPGHGWRDAESEEASNPILAADGIGDHEAQLAWEIVVVA